MNIKKISRKRKNLGKKTIDCSEFNNLHISYQTKKSLFKLGFKKMTSIQKISIPPGLKGLDVLGSARTGSGKSLCFIIPVIEILFIREWSNIDSIGAIILCPIRELAIQIFDLTKNISSGHNINSGIIIGGNKFNYKKKVSVLISTPGSFLNVIFDSKTFNCNKLKMLAIDEADKMLNKSFWRTMNFMTKFLPKKKQVLLFSATLNSKIRNIARLNLKNPIFCCLSSVNQLNKCTNIFPLQFNINHIKHFAIITNYEEKINLLFSFLKSHKKQKLIIFLSTKKQVKFLFEFFKIFNSDFLIFNIYGSMNQQKRLKNFISFNKSTKGFLFCTDLAARGLDFKSVDWIVQFDCPQNMELYIHRVGRTGRFLESGKAILFLYPAETKFLEKLDKSLVKIHNLKILKKHFVSINKKIDILSKKNINFKYLVQNAFFAYAKFIFLQKNKNISDFHIFNWNKIASSYGLNTFFSQVKN